MTGYGGIGEIGRSGVPLPIDAGPRGSGGLRGVAANPPYKKAVMGAVGNIGVEPFCAHVLRSAQHAMLAA